MVMALLFLYQLPLISQYVVQAFLPLVTTLPNVFFLVLFLKRALQTRQRMLWFLASLFALYTVLLMVSLGQFFALSREAAELRFLVAQGLEMGLLYTLILVLEMFERDAIYSPRQTLLAILAALAIGTMLAGPELVVTEVEGTYIVTFSARSVVRGLQALFNLVASVWLLVVLNRSRKAAHAAKQKRLIAGLAVGITFTMVIGSFLPVTIGIVEGQLQEVSIQTAVRWIGIAKNVGMVIVGVAFYRVLANPWLLQRQRVRALVVFSREGVDLYSRVIDETISESDVTLLTGGLSAVAAMFQEATKTRAGLHAVTFRDQEFRVVARPHFYCAMLVAATSEAAEIALARFADGFEARFHEALADFGGDVAQFESANALAEKFFS